MLDYWNSTLRQWWRSAFRKSRHGLDVSMVQLPYLSKRHVSILYAAVPTVDAVLSTGYGGSEMGEHPRGCSSRFDRSCE